MEKMIMKNFIKTYFRENYPDLTYDLSLSEDTFTVRFNEKEHLIIKKDSVFGWIYYGFIEDQNFSIKVEDAFQEFIDNINKK